MKNRIIHSILIISIMLVSISCSLFGGTRQGDQSNLSLPDGASLNIVQSGLPNNVEVSIDLISQDKRSYDEFYQVGSLYEISFGGAVLDSPATLTLPYNPNSLPEDVNPETLFIAYYDENVQDWHFVGGDVDTENHLISVKTDHASRWSVFTWNWDAWIAVLDNFFSGSVISWIEAVNLLTDDCPQSGEGVWVDTTNSGNMIQGCVELDEESEAVLRVVNPKSFYYEITANSEEQGINFSEILSPGGSYDFGIDKIGTPPVEVRAEITQKAGIRLVIHMVLKMLPGFNALPNQPTIVACVTERLEEFSFFASMAEDLFDADEYSALKVTETFIKFSKDKDAIIRFLNVTDDCASGIASTWSWENVSLIMNTSNVIIEGWDFLVNYIATMHRSSSQVVFNWTQLGPDILETIVPDPYVVELGGTYNYFWVEYDPEMWQVGEDAWGPNLTIINDPNCILRENVGMGIGGVDVVQFQEQIGSYDVDVTQYLSGGKVFLEILSFTNENIFIAIHVGDNSDYCLDSARQVVEDSAERNFNPE